ncbi:MAG: hypothetical protein JSR64_15745 [Nitrospira sp.]|nr:hypothetical protein [Nitrospira sp.]
MTTYLRCLRCETKQVLLSEQDLKDGCPSCGSAQSAENERGEPLVLFSKILDFNKWEDPAHDNG